MYGEKWHVVADQEIDIDAVMRSRIEFDSGQDMLEGILAYGMQRHVLNQINQKHSASSSLAC
jgi:hypothetical protein